MIKSDVASNPGSPKESINEKKGDVEMGSRQQNYFFSFTFDKCDVAKNPGAPREGKKMEKNGNSRI